MTTYYRGRRKWRRPATDFPDRAHAAGVADLVHNARLEADRKDREFFENLTGGDDAKGESTPDPNPAT